MTRGKKKPKSGRGAPPPAKKADAAFRPFAALKALKETRPAAANAEEETTPRRPAPSAAPSPRAGAAADRPALEDDDALVLHRMMSGVTPLSTKARRIPRSHEALPESRLEERRERGATSAVEEAAAVQEHLSSLVEGGRFEVEDDGMRVEGRRAGLPPGELRKLRRGLFPIDARIDLHGMRADEARSRMERFLGEKRARGERCVLIVHGKGEHSPGRQGVLRGEMSAWLSQGLASVHVAAFATAQPHDGGEGALYVLLMR